MNRLSRIPGIIAVLLIITLPKGLLAQRSDSLLAQLQRVKNDSAKIQLLFKISSYYRDTERNSEQWEKYLLEAKKVAESTKSPKIISNTYNKIGISYRRESRSGEAIKFHTDALAVAQGIKDSSEMATSYNYIGVVYRRIDSYALATENHIKALKIAEKCADEYNMSVACNSLGNIFSVTGQYDVAIDYFNKALELSKKSNSKLGLAMNYNNIGEVYEFMGNYVKARELYAHSLAINKEIKSDRGISICYNCLGKIALYEDNAMLAYKYFKEALDIDIRLDNKRYTADSYINLARASLSLKKYDEAKRLTDKGLEIALGINSLLHAQYAHEIYSNYYKALGQYRLAFENILLANQYKDSILNEKTSRIITSIQTLYESEKQESQIKILKQEQEIQEREFARQRTSNIILLAGFFIMVGVACVVYYMFREKRKSNTLLSNQIAEIERKNRKLAHQKEEIAIQKEDIIRKKELIEIKNKNLESAYRTIETYVSNMTESIRYAEKIQESIQPSLGKIKEYFSDTVVFSKPKDIVSGDFYWLLRIHDKVIFALADCTGHGVPGAFMSIIGIDLLNQAVRQNKRTDSAEILSFVNTQLIKRLRRTDSERILMDSMDIAICVYDINTKVLDFSGTLIPLILILDGNVVEIKPSTFALGSIFKEAPKNFKTETVQLSMGDYVYISSDGFFDQVGGEKNRKYQRERFKKFVLQNSQCSGIDMHSKLNEEFFAWKGSNEQIDDVLVWGIKI